MTKREWIEGLIAHEHDRRVFAKMLVRSGAWAAVATATLAPTVAEAQSELDVSDEDILNFALTLEYVDTEFFTVATTGRRLEEAGIPVSGRGRTGPTVGGRAVSLSPRIQAIAEQLTLDEQGHVLALRDALGSAAVAKPTVNLEALGIGFGSEAEFLTLARAFEDVGMSAYNGTAALIRDRQVLAKTAAIALAEAQHVGVVRLAVSDASVQVPQLDALDVPPLGSPSGRLFQVGDRGLATARTPSQVLAILYGNATPGTERGGFLPDGANGRLNRV